MDDYPIIEEAYAIAVKNLRSCYRKRKTRKGIKKLLVAGCINFREPWARDFSFASFGASKIKDFRVVKTTLKFFFDNQKEDGLLPLRMESSTMAERTVRYLFQKRQSERGVLEPRYVTEHYTKAVDSNSLLVIAFENYFKESKDKKFARKYYLKLIKAVEWLLSQDKNEDFLIEQDYFADWADSLGRIKTVLYSNVCFYKSLIAIENISHRLGEKKNRKKYHDLAVKVKGRINEFFWSKKKGYYKNSDIYKNFSSDGNVLAIIWGVADYKKKRSIEEYIERHKLDEPVPLRTVDKEYKDILVTPLVVVADNAKYHNGFSWIWLGAIDVIAKAKSGMKRKAIEELQKISNIILRDMAVHEVYDEEGIPVNNPLYKAECPFAWSAGLFIYAVNYLFKGKIR